MTFDNRLKPCIPGASAAPPRGGSTGQVNPCAAHRGIRDACAVKARFGWEEA